MRRIHPAAFLVFVIAAVFAVFSAEPRSAGATIVPGTITTVAGGGIGDGAAATAAALRPYGVAVDSAGNTYIADGCRVRKVTSGTITTAIGTGTCGYSGDGGPAGDAQLSSVTDVALDAGGNLFIAESCRIRKVSGSTITTVAGNGICGFFGDAGSPTSAELNYPQGIVFDAGGNLYIADTDNCRVRKVAGGVIATIAGNGTCDYTGDGGPATSATLANPYDVAVDPGGNVYIADSLNCLVRKVNAAGTISTFAGSSTCGNAGDGGPAASAQMQFVTAVLLDSAGNVYIADYGNCRVREVASGTITTFAGSSTCGSSGDGGSPTAAALSAVNGLAIDTAGNVFISDNCRVRKVTGATITTFAGNGLCNQSGDGGAATSASIAVPKGVAVDTAGNTYIAQYEGCSVRKVNAAGVITTFAGTANCGYSGDGGPASSATLSSVSGVAVDAAGNVYIADDGNCAIRKVSAGTITTVAGNGVCGYGGDNGPATAANLDTPAAVAVDSAGKIYIADSYNCRVRRVSAGTITTFAGNGVCDYGGDGGPATSANLSYVQGVAADAAGNVYIADAYNNRVRKVFGGTITTFAGTGVCDYTGDGGPASAAALCFPAGIATDGAGNLYIADLNNSRVREVIGGVIDTAAGNGGGGSDGDGGIATNAAIGRPNGIAVDAARNLYIADPDSNRIRKVAGQDSDGDGCFDAKELGATALLGGSRDPDNGFDFFDTPEPVLRAGDTSGVRSHAVTLADAIGVLYYIGALASSPAQANSNGATYGSDFNVNGILDGAEYDRTIPDGTKPWRSGAPNGTVSISDAIVALAQVGANCNS